MSFHIEGVSPLRTKNQSVRRVQNAEALDSDAAAAAVALAVNLSAAARRALF